MRMSTPVCNTKFAIPVTTISVRFNERGYLHLSHRHKRRESQLWWAIDERGRIGHQPARRSTVLQLIHAGKAEKLGPNVMQVHHKFRRIASRADLRKLLTTVGPPMFDREPTGPAWPEFKEELIILSARLRFPRKNRKRMEALVARKVVYLACMKLKHGRLPLKNPKVHWARTWCIEVMAKYGEQSARPFWKRELRYYLRRKGHKVQPDIIKASEKMFSYLWMLSRKERPSAPVIREPEETQASEVIVYRLPTAAEQVVEPLGTSEPERQPEQLNWFAELDEVILRPTHWREIVVILPTQDLRPVLDGEMGVRVLNVLHSIADQEGFLITASFVDSRQLQFQAKVPSHLKIRTLVRRIKKETAKALADVPGRVWSVGYHCAYLPGEDDEALTQPKVVPLALPI